MGLIGLLQGVLSALTSRCSRPPTRRAAVEEMAYDLWAGPDDLWPPEPQIPDTASEPQLVVSPQWGLRLPSGEIVWTAWGDLPLADPLDRARMVATLQKTAVDVGFGDGQAAEEFLANYGWVTRNQIATVVYEDTGTYPLTDSRAFSPTGDGVHPSGDHNDDESVPATNGHRPHDPGRDVREGPVGGDP